jgi:hypothetical protein
MFKWFVGILVLLLFGLLIANVQAGGPPAHAKRQCIRCNAPAVTPPPPILYRPVMAPVEPVPFTSPLCTFIKDVVRCPFRIVRALDSAVFGPDNYRYWGREVLR